MNKQFFGIIVVVIVALVGIFVLTSKDDAGSGNKNSSATVSEHIKKAPNSKVTLREFADFQCPACKTYFPVVKQLEAEYKDKVNFQFSHFPLTQLHPNAFLAARAAEAAGEQGKFFEMHDLLYENQDTWAQSSDPNTIFQAFAKQLNLDEAKFKTDLNSADAADTINADIKAGQALGANSTPTFVLNGKKLDKNPQSIDEFKKLLDDAIKKAQ